MSMDDAGVAGPGSSPSVEPQTGLDASHSIPIAPRCGDHVHHQPLDEDWVVAYADPATGDLAPAGWPNTLTRISDCTLIYRCTDEEHASAVRSWLQSGDDPDGRQSAVRRLYARGIDASGQGAQRLDAERESPKASPLGDAPKSSLEIKAQEGRA